MTKKGLSAAAAFALVLTGMTAAVTATPALAAGCKPRAWMIRVPNPGGLMGVGYASCYYGGSGYIKVRITCVREVDGLAPITRYGARVWSNARDDVSGINCPPASAGYVPSGVGYVLG